MNIILDTHAFIWYVENDTQLSSKAKSIIYNKNNSLFVSIATLWEMAIKINIGKLSLIKPFQQVMDDIPKNGFLILSVKEALTLFLSSLPRYHNDPFDRMLIAQSQVENMPLVTKDPDFANYGTTILW